MSSIKSENLKNKKLIDDMTQQLSQLKSSVAKLMANQKKMTDDLNRQKQWQDDVSTQLTAVAQGQQDLATISNQLTENNKIRDAKADRIGAKLNTLLNLAAANSSPNQVQSAGKINTIMEGQSNFIMLVT